MRLGGTQPRPGVEGKVVETSGAEEAVKSSGGWRKGHEESGFGQVMISF